MKPIHHFQKDSLTVGIYESRAAMGAAAAQDGAQLLRTILQQQQGARVVFAAAPSQTEMLDSLVHASGVDWNRITAFHLDEYIGLDGAAPQGFGNFLRRRIFDHLPLGRINFLDGGAPSREEECARYAALLNEAPIDLVFLGIGENGHIAFNDPPVADFSDPHLVKVVELDSICRNQQVNDGCFAHLDHVPTHALTLTVPALAAARHHIIVVPAASKAAAVRAAVEGPIEASCPASILRTCPGAVLYLEPDSAGLLGK